MGCRLGQSCCCSGQGACWGPWGGGGGGWGCFPGLASLVLELGSGWPERLAGARAKVASTVLAGLGLTLT